MVKKSASTRRRTTGPRKGDVREREILDATEKLLATRSYPDITVSDIAEAAAITRGALYFYFASKQDVVTELVAQTVQDLREKVSAVANDTRPPDAVIATALDHTLQLWVEHGVVMRTAIDLSSTVPAIDELWDGTATISADAITEVLLRMGLRAGRGPEDAPALARALCWMIERTFYQASKISIRDLHQAKQTCQAIWLRTGHTR
jgi:TetR/AcrR family transcriptional regulator, ethionamide resistance regulator